MHNAKGKVIIIGGCPRAGKTTLSVKLVKSGRNFSRISFDQMVGAFNKFSGVIENLLDREEVERKTFEALQSLLGDLVGDADVYGIHTVFDQYDINGLGVFQ